MNPKPLLRTLCYLSLCSAWTAHAADVSSSIGINPIPPAQDALFDIFINETTCRDTSQDSIEYTAADMTYRIILTLNPATTCPPAHVAPRFIHSQIAEDATDFSAPLPELYRIVYRGLNINNPDLGNPIDTGATQFFVGPPPDDQVYIPLNEPCRIVSTGGTQTPLNHLAIRSFRAWGNVAQLNTQRAAVEAGVALGACQPEPGLTPSSLVANITVAAQAFKSTGNMVAYPGNSDAPTGSLVNFSNNNIANSSIIALDSEAANQHFKVKANILNNEAGGSKQANVIIDSIGYFYPKSEFRGLANRNDLTYIPLNTPCRIVNTGGSGQVFNHQTTRSFRAWGNINQLNAQRDTDGSEVLGGCFPEVGLTPSAVAANITVAAQFFKSKGNIVAYPDGAAVPASSLVNFKANNIANSSIIGLGPLKNGSKNFTIRANIFGNNDNGSKQANVVADVIGFFYAHSEVDGLNPRLDLSYIPLETPCRIVNTGAAGLTFTPSNDNQTFLASGSVADLSGQRGSGNPACLPEEDLIPEAMAANVTVAAKAFNSKGNVVAYPANGALPSSSLVNFRSNNIANSSLIALDANQQFKVQANINTNDPSDGVEANVIVDVVGYFYQQ